jgi:hypothetical protein
MIYGVMVRGKDGYARWVYDSVLPGLIPDHVFDAMVTDVVDDLGLCKLCDVQGARCHVFEEVQDGNGGRKMCPILFHDVVKPKWKVEDVS